MVTSESPDAALESLVGQIADEFTRRYHRGEAPRLEEYTERYPELAGLLREILPAIEALGPARAETPRTNDTPGRATPAPPPADLADYEILGEIGRGGMGVVYRARHRILGRTVALKMLRGTGAEDLARFRAEAQAIARLQHPNIVQIFEVHEGEGQPLLALEFVESGSLAERVRGEPQPPREAAALVRTLARAIAAAHASGLVHRDLKPRNVLLATRDRDLKRDASESVISSQSDSLSAFTPKITDFGLAKRLDEDLGQTQTGAIVGTPGYMAPEQTMPGASVGPAADLFSLGAILYELLTGRPPFKGPSVLDTLELVRRAEPIPPSQLQPGCPRDLETICLKCLRKEPAQRYTSAEALADDLERFLDGKPILARPAGAIERLGKWVRRRPALAASLALGTLTTLAVVALTVRLVHSWELEDANRNLGDAVKSREAALLAEGEARRTAERNHQEASEARTQLDAALDRERALHYIHSINLAQREWQANRVDEARRILDACPADLRHWEWHYLYRQCHAELLDIRGHVGGIMALAVSSNGELVAAASGVNKGKLEWDLKIWDSRTGKLKQDLIGHEKPITDVAFSPDGTLLASTSYDRTIRLWDTRTGREVRRITTRTASRRVAFSPDGTRLAALPGSQVSLYDVSTGIEAFTLSGHERAGLALAFSATGQRLVTAGLDRVVTVWDLATKKEAFRCRGHTGLILDVAFSPRQDYILSCGMANEGTVRGELRLWNASDGKPAPFVLTFPYRISAAAFTPDARTIACATDDGSLLFFEAKSGRLLSTVHGHGASVQKLMMTGQGDRLLTGMADRTIRVWPVRNPEYTELSLHPMPTAAMTVSSDGTRIAISDSNQSASKGNKQAYLHVLSKEGADSSLKIPLSHPLLALCFTPDYSCLAGADQFAVRLWDIRNPAERLVIKESGVIDVSVSPNGDYLATASRNPQVNPRPDLVNTVHDPTLPRFKKLPSRGQVSEPTIKVWRIADGQLIHTLRGQLSTSFNSDGRYLAGARDDKVVVWDARSGAELRSFEASKGPILKVQFTAGGRQVVGFTHRQATVWDTDTGRTIATVDGLNGPAFITPDGRRIVSLQAGIKWWDVQTGRELLFLPMSDARLRQLALSADGRRVVVSSDTRFVLWEAGPP